MDPDSFENSIHKKFENQTKKAPSGIWDNIDNALNADLVSEYETQHSIYKWISAAAVLFIAILLGVLLVPTENVEKVSFDGPSYNALLSNNWDTQNYYASGSKDLVAGDLSFQPARIAKENSVTTVFNQPTFSKSAIMLLPSKSIDLLTAEVNQEIHPYYMLGSYARLKSKKQTNDTKAWAGVEAGAGTFNADFAGSGVLSNSLNPAALASAIGSGNFVNPTTNIAQNMEDGITTSLGVDFGVSLGKNWTLESGVAYTRMDNRGSASISVLDLYTIDNSDLISAQEPLGEINTLNAREASIEVENSYDHEVDLTNSMQFATIPLKAGYFVVDKKVSLRVNAGLSANYLMQGDLSDPSKTILNSDQLNLYNDWSFDGIGGLELGYSIFNKFDLTIEPNYRHSITPISNSVSSPSRFVVQTGLRYTLK